MPSLFDLPDEIISIIAYYMDGFSRIHLSKSCKRFNNFFVQNSITRHTSFPFHYASDNCSDIQSFIKNNHAHITHLDISYSQWKYDLILRVIKDIANLKYLNVIGTDIYSCSISTVLETNKSIESIEYSYNIDDSFPKKKLKYLHIAIDRLQVLGIKCLNLENVRVDKLEITAASIDSKFVLEFIPLRHMHDITIRLSKFMPVRLATVSILRRLTCKYYVAIETTCGIFISPSIVDEFIGMNSLIYIDSLKKIRGENAITIYFCSKKKIAKVEKFKNKIKDIISKRSSFNIALYGSNFSPTTQFDIVRYIAFIKDLKRLSIHSCVLATKVQPSDAPRNHSDIRETSVLEKIATAHKNIEMLQIISKLNLSCLSGFREWTLDPKYLESILLLKNLKYLTLTHCPHINIPLIKAIFEQCQLLEQVSITTILEDITQNIFGILNICKNIKTFHLDSAIDIIHFFLDSMESSTLSSVYISYYDEGYRGKGDELQSVLMQMPSRCPRLKYLTMYNTSRLPAYQIKNFSRIEKIVNKKHNSFVVNLITPKHLLLNRINDIGQFI